MGVVVFSKTSFFSFCLKLGVTGCGLLIFFTPNVLFSLAKNIFSADCHKQHGPCTGMATLTDILAAGIGYQNKYIKVIRNTSYEVWLRK